MSADPVLLEDTLDWLRHALRDIQAAQADLASPHALFEDVLFHAQQCAEKSLKAWLLWRMQPVPKTHNLAQLAALCRELGPELDNWLAAVEGLTPFATLARYPGDGWPEPPAKEEAVASLAAAQELYAAVARLVPGEAGH